MAEGMIPDSIRTTFHFFYLLKPAEATLFFKVLVSSLNSYQIAELVQSAELMVQKDIKQPPTFLTMSTDHP